MRTIHFEKTISRLLRVVAAMMMLTGCSNQIRVYSDYDKEANLHQYKTYTWHAMKNIEAGRNQLYYNELNDKRIKREVSQQMNLKGYIQADTLADLILHYHIIVDDRTALQTDPYGYYYGPYWMNSRISVYQYREGTLIIDLMDAKSNNLIWRGWAISILEETDPQKIEERLQVTIEKIFRDLPKQQTRE